MSSDHFENNHQESQRIVPPWAYPPPMVHYDAQYTEEEINLLDMWRVLAKRKWQILAVIFLATSLALVMSWVMPKKYTAKVALMPLTSNKGGGSLSAMAASLSNIPLLGSQLGGISEELGGGKSKELINILKSRTLSEKIINRFDLMKMIFANQYDSKTRMFYSKLWWPVPVMEDAVKKLTKKITEVELDKKTGLIEVEVTMKDADLAERVANGMVVELQDFISNNTLTVAKRNRIFIEEQMVKTKAKLLEAGKELNQFYSQNRISSVIPEIDVDAGSYEAQPVTFEEFRQEFEALQGKQDAAERKVINEKVRGVPGQVYLQYLTFNRELLAKTYTLLAQQYEISKIEEAKEDLAFQVIDRARVMIRPSSPKLMLNLVIGFTGGLFVAVFAAFFLEYLQKLKAKEAAG
jgi:uncharacterized protein involved in exopolysaccharide biosynthesis